MCQKRFISFSAKLLEKHLLAVELKSVQTVYAKGVYDNYSLPMVVLVV